MCDTIPDKDIVYIYDVHHSMYNRQPYNAARTTFTCLREMQYVLIALTLVDNKLIAQGRRLLRSIFTSPCFRLGMQHRIR